MKNSTDLRILLALSIVISVIPGVVISLMGIPVEELDGDQMMTMVYLDIAASLGFLIWLLLYFVKKYPGKK